MHPEDDDHVARTREALAVEIAGRLLELQPTLERAPVDAVVRFVVEHATTGVGPPRVEYRTDSITADVKTGEVSETRFTHLLVNPRPLLRLLAEGTATLTGLAMQSPWAIISALYMLFDTALNSREALTRTLDETEALIVWAVLLNQTESGTVALSDLRVFVAAESVAWKVIPPDQDKIDAALDRLRRSGGIRTVVGNPERIYAASSTKIDLR